MRRIAVTGSIAMGKSYITNIIRKCGVRVLDSDQAVREIIVENKEVISKEFPESLINDKIDRKILADIIFNDPSKRLKLEKITHPLVAKKKKQFIKKATLQKNNLIMFDQVLLFEKNHQRFFDVILLASTSKIIQSKRALTRKNMTKEKLSAILATQMPDHKKRLKADYVIHTGANKASIFRQIKAILYDPDF